MAVVTTGTMSATGDVLAQLLVNWQLWKDGLPARPYEVDRTLRMLGFGSLFYGPFQHYWYRALANAFPGTAPPEFFKKLLLNQVVLGPVVLAFVFSWNLALTQQADKIPGKIRRDFAPTIVNGWKFWVPAAALNFYAIPTAQQVLFMSTCGVVWTAYLSFASYNSANAIVRTADEQVVDEGLPGTTAVVRRAGGVEIVTK